MNSAVLDAPAAPRPGLQIDTKWVVIGACVVLVAWLALVPLGFLLWQSFLTPQTAAKSAEFTLGNYVEAY